MMDIYQIKDLKKPNFLQKVFGKNPIENSIIELNNLFALNQKDLNKISPDQITEIEEKYKINFKNKFKENRIELYKILLQNCLMDLKLDNSDIELLNHIKDILKLDRSDADSVLKLEVEKLYKQAVKNAVQDGELEDIEKEELLQLQRDLSINDDVANDIYQKTVTDIYQVFVNDAIADERLSPDEETRLKEIALSLGIDYKIDSKSRETFDRYKLYWKIENAELPEVTSDISIQKSEKLHFKTYVNWLEKRAVTKRINYSGPTARLKIVKGVYYRVGSISPQRISEDEWLKIDSGKIYLTNKRLIFMGSKGNKTIPLTKILDIKAYKNGVDIMKDTGKSPFLEFSSEVDIFTLILIRLLNEE